MEMSGHLHGEIPSTGWTPEPVWVLWVRDRDVFRRPAHSLVAVSTQLPRLAMFDTSQGVTGESVQRSSYLLRFPKSKSKSHSDLVSLGSRPPSDTRDQFFFLLEVFFRQLRVCYFVAPSLTRGQVCNLLLLLVLASAVTLGLPSLTRGQVCLLSAFC
jgi:hypothetical protein